MIHFIVFSLSFLCVKEIRRLQQWPKEAIPLGKYHPPLQDIIYYEHAKEGLLHTKWSNPLPMPTCGYNCDLCQAHQIQLGWQMV